MAHTTQPAVLVLALQGHHCFLSSFPLDTRALPKRQISKQVTFSLSGELPCASGIYDMCELWIQHRVHAVFCHKSLHSCIPAGRTLSGAEWQRAARKAHDG